MLHYRYHTVGYEGTIGIFHNFAKHFHQQASYIYTFRFKPLNDAHNSW